MKDVCCFACIARYCSLVIFLWSLPHESAGLLGMGLSWGIWATNDQDGLITEVWQTALNLDAISRPFLCSNHAWDWA